MKLLLEDKIVWENPASLGHFGIKLRKQIAEERIMRKVRDWTEKPLLEFLAELLNRNPTWIVRRGDGEYCISLSRADLRRLIAALRTKQKPGKTQVDRIVYIRDHEAPKP